MIKLILPLLFMTKTLSAQPELRSKNAIKIQQSNGIIKAELAAGHHFNEKAPNGFQSGEEFVSPLKFDKQKLDISLEKAKNKKGVAHFYVCDDEVTYCEVHSVPIGEQKSQKAKFQQKNEIKIKHGFLQNAFNEALAQAKKSKRLIIVDFGARWCPACIRLESEIFSLHEFSKLTKNFIKVKIDGDLFYNAPILDRYKIKGYPTVLFLTSNGDEIIRFMDYQNFEFLKNFVAHAEEFPISIQEIETREVNTSVKEALWKRYYFSGDFEKALKVIETLPEKPKEYLNAKVELALSQEKAENIDSIKNSIKTLKEVLKFEADSTRSLSWRSQLIDKLKEDKKTILVLAQEAEKLKDKFLKEDAVLKNALLTDSIGEFAGFEKFYVALIYADIAEQADYKKEEAWKSVVKIGQESKISSQHPGASLRLFNAMMKAKEYAPALEVIDGLLSKKPDSGDFQRRKMRVLMELNRHEEAVKIGELALKNSYGRNEFDVALPLAKSYLSLNNKKRARSLAQVYLDKNEVNYPRMAQMKKDLEEVKLKSSVQSEGPTESHPNKK